MRPHKKLIVWQEAIELVQTVYFFSAKIPLEEKYGLASQLKRAVTSVPLNIAEGAARNTKKEFIHFLYIAEGSLSETDTILTLCVRLKFCKQEEVTDIEIKMEKISAMIQGLIKKLKKDVSS